MGYNQPSPTGSHPHDWVTYNPLPPMFGGLLHTSLIIQIVEHDKALFPLTTILQNHPTLKFPGFLEVILGNAFGGSPLHCL